MYSNRQTESYRLEHVSADGNLVEIRHAGWGFATPDIPAEFLHMVEPGVMVTFESINNAVVGMSIGGMWLYRKTDHEVAVERARFREQAAERQRAQLEEHRERYMAREAGLPDWIRARIESFHETGGETFELEGWGYELCIAELAVLYVESGGSDSERVKAFAEMLNTSLHQHNVAKTLAQHHTENMAGTPSALTPLGIDPGYRKDHA